jgi:hypothetical protein
MLADARPVLDRAAQRGPVKAEASLDALAHEDARPGAYRFARARANLSSSA